MRYNRLLLYAEADGMARALLVLRRRAFPGSDMEQATSELVNYDNDDKADFRKL